MASILGKLFGEKEVTTVAVADGGAPAVEPIHVGDEDFADIVLNSGKPAVVDLWAEWCGPCHMVAPTVEALAREYEGRAVIAKLDVDTNPQTPMQYGIMGIPTLLFFKDGKEVDRQVGVASYSVLAGKLERLIN